MSKTKQIKRARREQRAATAANEEFNAVRPIGVSSPVRVNPNPLQNLDYDGAPVNGNAAVRDAVRDSLLVNIGSEKYPVLASTDVAEQERAALMGAATSLDMMQVQNIENMIESAVRERTDPYHSINQDLTEVYLALYGAGAVGSVCANPMEYDDWNISKSAHGGVSWNDVYPQFWQRQIQRLRLALKLTLSGEVPCTYRATTIMMTLNSLVQTRVTFTVKQYHDGRKPTVHSLVHSK